MGKYKIKLLWFNAWFGLVWLIAFVPSLLFFVHHELFLQTGWEKAVVTQVEITISDDGSYIKVETDKGVFYYRDREFFDNLIEGLSETAEYIEIWYSEESRGIVDIRINQSDFIIPSGSLATGLFLFLLILSSFALAISIMLIIQTKGWGDEDLFKKYPKGLLRTIFG